MQPEKLGPYRIDRRIGRGGMGTVYAAVDAASGEAVAVKILSPALSQDEGFRQRFEAEIESLKKLRHEGIVRLYGYGYENESLYYGMELVDGPSLEDELAAGRRFDWRETTRLAIQVARALKHAHDHGVIHRDVKPGNLLLVDDEHVKLSDFGVARRFGARLTGTGGVIGTADFMSPEQAEGEAITPRADLYSLGCVMYAMLAGRPPFVAENMPALLHQHRYAAPEPVCVYAPDAPRELETIICRLLAKKPADRFVDAGVAARALESALDKMSISDAVAPLRPSTTKDLPEDPPAPIERIGSGFTKADESAPPTESPPSTLQTLLSVQTLSLIAALVALLGWVVYQANRPTVDDDWRRISAVAADGNYKKLVAYHDEMQRLAARLDDDDPRRRSLESWTHWVEIIESSRGASRQAKLPTLPGDFSPLQHAYLDAVRLSQSDPAAAVDRLRAMIDLCTESETDPDQAFCVELATEKIEAIEAEAKRRLAARRALLDERMNRAVELLDTDRMAAREIWQAIIRHYANEPWAAEFVAQARTALDENAMSEISANQ